MDGGSLRGPRAVNTRGANRQEQLARKPAEPVQALSPEPQPSVTLTESATTKRGNKQKKSFKRFIGPILVLLVAGALLIGGWTIWKNTNGLTAGVDSSKYQAVFFTNGQVYFGKLQSLNSETMKLTDIFYLQGQDINSTEDATDSKNPQSSSEDSNNVQLIKLGQEIHGPEDQMIISKNQVLFYENLKTDSKVAQTIEKSKSGGDF